jgi:saccharopine dehydrogenase-like NADP-dependent oxidoreductase
MKALIFGGGGRIGSAAAWDLARYGDCDAVGIVARNAKSLNAVRSWINSDRVVPHILDIADREASRRLMREYDVTVLALPDRRSSYQTLETAIEADPARGISAMARVTGFTAALGARMLAEGRVRVKGIAAPEEAISGTLYQRLISGLSERGIAVVEQMRST